MVYLEQEYDNIAKVLKSTTSSDHRKYIQISITIIISPYCVQPLAPSLSAVFRALHNCTIGLFRPQMWG